MKNKLTLNSILTLLGLIAAGVGAYVFAHFFLILSPSEPAPVL